MPEVGEHCVHLIDTATAAALEQVGGAAESVQPALPQSQAAGVAAAATRCHLHARYRPDCHGWIPPFGMCNSTR